MKKRTDTIRNNINEAANNIKNVAKGAAQSIYDHKGEIGAGLLLAIGALKQVSRLSSKYKEEVQRKRSIYDPKTFHRWPLKREMTSQDYLDLEKLEKKGYSKGEALRMLGLLKER